MAPPKTNNAKRGTTHGAAAHNLLKFTIRAAPLPKPIVEFVHDNLALLRRMQQQRNSREEHPSRSPLPSQGEENGEGGGSEDRSDEDIDDLNDVDLQGEVLKRPSVRAEEFWPTFEAKCNEVGGEWADIPERLWAFGPLRAGTCLLVDSRPGQPTS